MIELGKCGISTYPINMVPRTLPKVLIAERRPTFDPTFFTDLVNNLIRKGPVIANNAKGIRKRKTDANRVAHANGNFMSFRQIGFTIGTVAAKISSCS